MRAMLFSSSLLVLGAAVVNAATIVRNEPPSRVIDKRASTCTPTAGGSSSTDDVPAIESAIASCSSGTIVIPSGSTYYINSAFSFSGCSGCTLEIEGTLKVASDTSYWEGKTAIFELSGISGANVLSTTGSGIIDGNGQDAWDLFASDSSYARPTLFYITDSENILVQNLLFKNAPNVFHSVTGGSSNVQYNGITLTAVSTSDNDPKNTDGWDIGSSTYVTLTDIAVINNDDCVAFKPGANYISVTNITCTGSHGLSVGSLGSSNTDTVQNVIVNGATMIDSTKAAGIKLYPGGSDHGQGIVTNVTWENVVVQNCDYAFQIQSCYGEDSDYCDEYPSTAQLTDVVAKGFSGTTSTKYEPTVANIDCPADGTCGATLSNFTVEAPDGDATYLCANTPSYLGVTCTSGASG